MLSVKNKLKFVVKNPSPFIVFVCHRSSVCKSLTVFWVGGIDNRRVRRVKDGCYNIFVKYLYNIVCGVNSKLFTFRLQSVLTLHVSHNHLIRDSWVYISIINFDSLYSLYIPTYNKSSYALMCTFYYATSEIFCRFFIRHTRNII